MISAACSAARAALRFFAPNRRKVTLWRDGRSSVRFARMPDNGIRMNFPCLHPSPIALIAIGAILLFWVVFRGAAVNPAIHDGMLDQQAMRAGKVSELEHLPLPSAAP